MRHLVIPGVHHLGIPGVRCLGLLAALALSACGDGSTAPGGDNGSGSPPPDTPAFSHVQAPGASARAFLSDETFDALVVEVDFVDGFDPGTEALDSLRTFLEARLHKPGGVTILLDDALPSNPGASYTLAEVRALEEAHRDRFTAGGTLAAYALFLDRPFEAEGVLGIAYFNTSMAIFEQVVRDHSGGVFEPPTPLVEATVLRHEVGHLLGLVNNGTAMQGTPGGADDHHDEAHGAHCTVEGSLMYFQVETVDFLATLTGGQVPRLEPLDLADLRANGGR
ncbi:MAG: hypothetical protein RQ751_10455 [Longimicrobiales bacterium]|nr:hypothetical protein [Longimicrobiales bacterium]